jgi:hypothetical protein
MPKGACERNGSYRLKNGFRFLADGKVPFDEGASYSPFSIDPLFGAQLFHYYWLLNRCRR